MKRPSSERITKVARLLERLARLLDHYENCIEVLEQSDEALHHAEALDYLLDNYVEEQMFAKDDHCHLDTPRTNEDRVDIGLLEEVVTGVELGLNDKRLRLSAAKKAQLISTLYSNFIEEMAAGADTVGHV